MSGEIVAIVSQAREEPLRRDLYLAALPRNDAGNAQRFADRRGDRFIHADNVGWYFNDGVRWVPPLSRGSPDAVNAALYVVSRIPAEARALQQEAESLAAAMDPKPPKDSPERKGWDDLELQRSRKAASADELFKFAVTSGNVGRVNAMLALAEPMLRCAPADLDRDPWKLNCPNCTLDLLPPGQALPGIAAGDAVDLASIARPRSHDPADLITRATGAHFDPAAKCPEFERLMETIQPDPSMRAFLQRWFGYKLTGDTSEQCVSMWWGDGSNGKSTAVDIVSAVLGSYATSVPIEAFLHDDYRKGSHATPELIPLIGARAAFAAEPPKGARLAEDQIKKISSGEVMQARPLFQGIISFRPQFKLVISFNPKPKITGQDAGIWRRIRLVPFAVKISDEERDVTLAERIKANELSGVLNWMLEGYRWWREIGLAPPAAIREATEEYRQQNDPIGEFVAACIVAIPGARLPAKRVYEAYCAWCGANGTQPLTGTSVGRWFSDKGYSRQKSGTNVYLDLDLSADGAALLEAKAEAKRSHHPDERSQAGTERSQSAGDPEPHEAREV